MASVLQMSRMSQANLDVRTSVGALLCGPVALGRRAKTPLGSGAFMRGSRAASAAVLLLEVSEVREEVVEVLVVDPVCDRHGHDGQENQDDDECGGCFHASI